MTGSSPSRAKVLTDPAQLTPAERAYYRTVWGFDPVGDCKTLGLLTYRYEACYDLTEDLPLQAAGVAICARVDWQGEAIHNRIVFRHGAAEAAVECTHTLVYAGPSSRVITFASDADLTRDEFTRTDWAKLARSGGLVLLPPWEHFAALKSYVAAVAQMGLLTMVRSVISRGSNKESPDLSNIPFGFNAAMQKQIFSALKKIIPNVTSALQEDLARELLDTVPPAWILERWEVLEPVYNFRALFIKEGNLFLTWIKSLKETFPALFLSSPVNLQIRGIIEQDWESVVRTWPLGLFADLCRNSNILDGVQDILFEDPEQLTRARQIQPNQIWDQLRGEWDARDFNWEFGHTLNEANDANELEEAKRGLQDIPPYEVWPRGPLYSEDYYPPLLSPVPSLNTPEAARKRLKDFAKQYQKYRKLNPDEIVDYFSGGNPLTPSESAAEFWESNYSWNVAGQQKPEGRVPSSIPSNGSLLDVRVVARNPLTPLGILQELASHWDLAIRLSVVTHPHADVDLIARFKQDVQPSVRAVAEARLSKGGNLILPLPGELLSPGELLWLLVQNEGAFLVFGISEFGDGTTAYKAWHRRRGQAWSQRLQLNWHPYLLGRVFYWTYWEGYLAEGQERGMVFSSLPLGGLFTMENGEFPFIFLNYQGENYGIGMLDIERRALLQSFLPSAKL